MGNRTKLLTRDEFGAATAGKSEQRLRHEGTGTADISLGPMLSAVLSAVSGVVPVRADKLEWAIVQAYQNNPSLNAQRAALRAVDENGPQALSGYRPKLSVTASGGYNYFRQVNKAVVQSVFPNSVSYTSIAEDLPTANSAPLRRKRFIMVFKPPSDAPGGSRADLYQINMLQALF
jgi:hypothetical protein